MPSSLDAKLPQRQLFWRAADISMGGEVSFAAYLWRNVDADGAIWRIDNREQLARPDRQ